MARNPERILGPARRNPADHAGPDGSFPIVNQTSVDNAERLKGRAANPAAVGARISEIAQRKGLSVPGKKGPYLTPG